MSIKSFFLKKMLASKLKDVPAAEQDKFFAALEKNPDLFKTIALEVQEKVKQGKDQVSATMEVMQKYQDDLRKAMQ